MYSGFGKEMQKAFLHKYSVLWSVVKYMWNVMGTGGNVTLPCLVLTFFFGGKRMEDGRDKDSCVVMFLHLFKISTLSPSTLPCSICEQNTEHNPIQSTTK